MAKKKIVEFVGLPGVTEGVTHLSIYPPGTWMPGLDGDHLYKVFVGGCGVGGKKTLAEAKRYLLERAIIYCRQQIERAQKVITHYTILLHRLETDGLREKETA